nr:MAG TPA: hypothetical protein [Caudoviricetes sp.]
MPTESIITQALKALQRTSIKRMFPNGRMVKSSREWIQSV